MRRLIISIATTGLIAWAAGIAAQTSPSTGDKPAPALQPQASAQSQVAALPPMRRIGSFGELIGKWEGTIRFPEGLAPVSMTINEDKTVTWSAGQENGTLEGRVVVGQFVMSVGWGKQYVFRLHEGEGRRLLRSEDGSVEVSRAQ